MPEPKPFAKRHFGGLAQGVSYSAGWLAARVLGQTIWVIAIARMLGSDGYGIFAGLAAIAATVGTLTGLGMGLLMLQDVSTEVSAFPRAWKQAIAVNFATGFGLCVTFALLVPAMASIEASTISYAMIAMAEIISFPTINLCSQAFQARGRQGWAGFCFAVAPIGNLLAVASCHLAVGHPTLSEYLPFHAALSALSACACVLLVRRVLSPKRAAFELTGRDMREGMVFTGMRAGDTAFNSIDRFLVLHFSTGTIAGNYSAAYRLISVLTLPLVALSMSALPRLFRADSSTLDARHDFVRILVSAVLIYGLLAGAVVVAAAPLLPILLGDDFQQAARAARWLAPLPFLQGMFMIGSNVLVARRARGWRITAQCLGIASLVVLIAVLVPRHGLAGAIVSLLCSQALAALLLWSWILTSGRRNIRRAIDE